jgi:eukaryotic-like serine/threonine-protein kinase
MPAIGQRLSHYKIVQQLGAGGMGVVFKAEDTKLPRLVALKFLSEAALADSHAVERFRREAYAASSLNHPNICTIYDIDEADGEHFIAMELMEGHTLKEAIGSKPLALDRILEIGIGVSDGLAAAHAKGIVHRDIKPANIFLTSSGQAKILDFGLAKLGRAGHDSAEGGVTSAATETVATGLTGAGTALGTVAYMSPEQALGEDLDARTDLFSLGVVLYEMATGVTPFRGASAAAMVDAILHQTPTEPVRLNPGLPAELEQIVRKALEKDRALRYQHASDLRADLQRLKRDSSGSVPVVARRRRRWPLGVAVAAVVVIAFVAFGIWYSNRTPALADEDTIVLADFENATGDAAFDKTLTEALSVALYQTTFLKLASADEVKEALKLMRRPLDSAIDADTAREICIRRGLRAYIAGSISALGSQYDLRLKALDAQSSRPLGVAQESAGSKEQVVAALGRAALDLRRKLGESLPSLERFNKPLEEATTSNLDALKQFSVGEELRRKGDFPGAIGYFERATQLDPDFALAHLRLGYSLSDSARRAEADPPLKRALELKDRVGERELLELSVRDCRARGDYDKAMELARQWIRADPRNPYAYSALGILLQAVGQYEEAVEAYRETARLEPVSGLSANLSIVLTCLGKYEEAEKTLRQALARGSEFDSLYVILCQLAAIRGDQAEMRRDLDRLKASSQGRARVGAYMLPAALAVVSGRLKAAHQLVQQAFDVQEQEKLSEFPPTVYVRLGAYSGALVGNCEGARTVKTIEVLIQCGNLEEAQAMAEKDLAANPENQLNSRVTYPMRMARIALRRGDYNKALTLSDPVVARYRDLGGFELFKLRGQAYLGLGDGKAAAAEFQQIIDRRGLDVWSINYPLAYVYLGRAWKTAGELAKSRKAYEDFFAFWKDADPDIPILIQAKEEYAKLR